MKKVKIIYHSGVGNTKLIAEIFFQELKKTDNVTLIDIHKESLTSISDSDFLILGFPTYHCEPSKSMELFISKIKKAENPIPAFIFTTCGLYSSNTLRIFSKKCIDLNIVPVGSRSYRTSATDAVLLFPYIRFIKSYQKNTGKKIFSDIKLIKELLERNTVLAKLPRFKLHSILNYPNKVFGKILKRKIYLLKNQCIKCSLCIKNCPYHCFTQNTDFYPQFNIKNCENCYRCIHRCPETALSVYKNKAVKTQFNNEYFQKKKYDIKNNK